MKKDKEDMEPLDSRIDKPDKPVANWFDRAKKTVISAVDQNNDGEFNMKDVAAMAEAIGGAAKKVAVAAKDSAGARAHEQELKTLCPIFRNDLDSTNFLMTKLIRITEIDKRRQESEVCKGSIGHMSVQKEMKIINIYRNNVDIFGLTFYPDMDGEVYYVDPFDRKRYIALDDYFRYLKEARINELQKIAQDLGATHFRVTYKEQQVAQATQKRKVNVKSPVTADVQREASATAFSTVEIAAEMTCPGHAPIKPQLMYLQKEPSIQSLITLRMDTESPITHQKYTLKLSNSSGIKENDAIKIDAALKSMKCSGYATVTTEAQKEANRFFEYEIDF